MKDSIRALDAEVVDVLRIILSHQPGRATMGYSGQGTMERRIDIAFCAAAEQTFVAAERNTGAKKGIIAKMFMLMHRMYTEQIRQIVTSIPEVYAEVSSQLGITSWPLFEQDQITEEYRASQGSREKLEALLAKYANHQLLPGLVGTWLLEANEQIQGLRLENGNFVERLRLIVRILEDDEAYVRVGNQLAVTRPTKEQLLINETPIEDLEFSVRTFNALKREGLNTLAELVACSKERLAGIRNWGRRCQDEVDAILVKYGFPVKE